MTYIERFLTLGEDNRSITNYHFLPWSGPLAGGKASSPSASDHDKNGPTPVSLSPPRCSPNGPQFACRGTRVDRWFRHARGIHGTDAKNPPPAPLPASHILPITHPQATTTNTNPIAPPRLYGTKHRTTLAHTILMQLALNALS